MKPNLVLAGVLAVLACGTAYGEVYRWVDKSGQVHYGDKRDADAASVEKKKFGTPSTGDEGQSYETVRAKRNFPVTLYVADNCADPCKQARNLLTQRGVPFTEKNLATPAEIEAFKKQSGADSVPVLLVGKTWLKGYMPEQWHGELDTAGYPKTSGYRPPAPAKPAAAKPAEAKQTKE